MRPDLDTLQQEIEKALRESPFALFRSLPRGRDPAVVYWDTDEHPDFHDFLQVARKLSVDVLCFHHRSFAAEEVDDVEEQLAASELTREETRDLERRLKELRGYTGFTCSLELSFDHQGRIYLFHMNANWFEDFLVILDELEGLSETRDSEEPPMGGYFSNN